jgi:hypothetical protein
MTRKQFILFTILLAATTLAFIDSPFAPRKPADASQLARSPNTAPPQPAPPSQPSDIPGVRQPHPVPQPGEVRQLTIKQLGNFDYENEKKIPHDVTALSGVNIRLSGFMMITNESDHIHQFALVPNLFSCCYGQPPSVQHVVMVTCPKDQPIEFTDELINVEGNLTVKEMKEDGYVTSLFQVVAKKVDAPK